MAQERLAPDAIAEQTNLTGVIGDIQDDPDVPDGNWWAASDHGADTVAHLGFPTPTGNPTPGANLQEFRVYARRSRSKNNKPSIEIKVMEGGIEKATSGLLLVNSLTGEVFSFTWDITGFSFPNGIAVEIYIFGDASGGNPANRETVEVGAVEWNCEYSAGPSTGWNKLQFASEPPTANAWNQAKDDGVTGGWRKVLYEGE